MKKKIIALLLALALMLCVGCNTTTQAARVEPNRFTTEHATGIGARYAYIITDTETGVQYLFVGENMVMLARAVCANWKAVRAMADLKCCPFCGGEAFVLKMDDHGFILFSVVCKACHASTNGKVKENGAIEAWERRVSDG